MNSCSVAKVEVDLGWFQMKLFEDLCEGLIFHLGETHLHFIVGGPTFCVLKDLSVNLLLHLLASDAELTD